MALNEINLIEEKYWTNSGVDQVATTDVENPRLWKSKIDYTCNICKQLVKKEEVHAHLKKSKPIHKLLKEY
jgi:hypothetical protein